MKARCVIINADDFGLTSEINRGIIEAHERGVVTSTSLMVRPAAAGAAAEYGRAHPRLSVGLHFDLGEWRFRKGEWTLAYRTVDATDASAVAEEFHQQLNEFRRLMGRDPTHLDTHQHAHLSEPCRSLLIQQARLLALPLRACGEIKYEGGFYGQTAEGASYPEGISEESLRRLFGKLQSGWTEIGSHPGYADGLDSAYGSEREQEIRVLCSAGIRQKVEQDNIRLCSFHDY